MSTDSDSPYKSPALPIADAPYHMTAPPALPWPNVPVAFAWLVGVLVAQIGFAVVAVIGIVIAGSLSGEPFDPAKLEKPTATQALVLLAASQFATAFVACIAAAVHLRKSLVERLQLRLPAPRHWFFGLFAIIPTSILASEAASIMGQIDGFSLKFLHESMVDVKTMPLAAVLLFACVFPGLFEELLFRGAIGRGLVGRHGWWVGIGVTSFFFGLAHIIPAHVVSAGLIGVFLHLAFLYSRSFWVPVTMHVVNNALAFLLLRNEEAFPIPGYTTEIGGQTVEHVPVLLCAAGGAALAALFLCWRHFRSEAPEAELAPAEVRSGSLGWTLVLGVVLTQGLLVAALANAVQR